MPKQLQLCLVELNVICDVVLFRTEPKVLLGVCLSVCLSVCLFVCLCVCVSVCVRVWLGNFSVDVLLMCRILRRHRGRDASSLLKSSVVSTADSRTHVTNGMNKHYIAYSQLPLQCGGVLQRMEVWLGFGESRRDVFVRGRVVAAALA